MQQTTIRKTRFEEPCPVSKEINGVLYCWNKTDDKPRKLCPYLGEYGEDGRCKILWEIERGN